jgi:hypothetical protein
MDIQVLNEIANLARQASLSKVSASVSANAQLKGLKGNPVPAPGTPATPVFEDSPEQVQAPVAPEISSVARAASAYSAAVGDGLNSDELNAIQDLAGKVRTAVSEFLSQPGLEQAENAAAVVASNPEAVQDFTFGVEQAVAATLSLPAPKGEVVVNAATPNADLPEEVPAPEKFISLERITHGAEPNHSAQVVAASPALQNAQAAGNARVETPVSRPDAVASHQQEPVNRPETVPASPQEAAVTPASPVRVHSRASENTSIENPVAVEAGVETSGRDFTVTAASPALQNAQAAGNAQVETPVSRPDAVASHQQEPVSHPEKVVTNSQDTPVTVEAGVEASSRDFTVTAASPALQNAPAGDRARVETPVSRPETVASPQQEPVTRPETVPANPQETPVVAASPELQNAPAGDRARVETPVSRPDAVASPQQEPVNRPETVPVNPQDTPVVAASPELQNAPAGDRARVETPVSRPETVASTQQEPVNRPETVPVNPQDTPVVAASPASQNAQAQNAEVGNPVNTPAPSVNQGQGSEGAQAQPVNLEGATASLEGASRQAASGQANPQPASAPQSGPAQSSGLFAQENAAVNPENIRNVNELVNSVVDNEFTSEAKKIFSEPKMIRTVADLADFILERLREIIASQQQQSQSSGEFGLS